MVRDGPRDVPVAVPDRGMLAGATLCAPAECYKEYQELYEEKIMNYLTEKGVVRAVDVARLPPRANNSLMTVGFE